MNIWIFRPHPWCMSGILWETRLEESNFAQIKWVMKKVSLFLFMFSIFTFISSHNLHFQNPDFERSSEFVISPCDHSILHDALCAWMMHSRNFGLDEKMPWIQKFLHYWCSCFIAHVQPLGNLGRMSDLITCSLFLCGRHCHKILVALLINDMKPIIWGILANETENVDELVSGNLSIQIQGWILVNWEHWQTTAEPFHNSRQFRCASTPAHWPSVPFLHWGMLFIEYILIWISQ